MTESYMTPELFSAFKTLHSAFNYLCEDELRSGRKDDDALILINDSILAIEPHADSIQINAAVEYASKWACSPTARDSALSIPKSLTKKEWRNK